jgi:hypothetical protein
VPYRELYGREVVDPDTNKKSQIRIETEDGETLTLVVQGAKTGGQLTCTRVEAYEIIETLSYFLD